jgi:phosphoglycolate phosphatase
MTVKLFLFDIDGTILLSGGAGLRGMEKVLHDLHGVPNAFDGITPDGKIDTAIFREMIRTHGIEVKDEDAAIKTMCEQYLPLLEKEMAVSEGALLMPGFPEILERLSALPGAHLGLVTGNLEPAAQIKVGRWNLNRFFKFGAYGSDHENRPELVRIAVSRAEKLLGQTIGMGPHIYVIGDTDRDIDAGRSNGASTIGVATNNASTADLKKAGADFVFEDFSDLDRVFSELFD